ncbi:MAG: redox-sensitive transcriptional activator SoxR [Kordiimonadaceae bacterium]|nr:redox-sensitive transcriptional activator SoxR [Kordiimonadaceae bacterium]
MRFYEAKGLVASTRNAGGQRRFLRSTVRRLSFVLITQKLGFSIQEIAGHLSALPKGRNPTPADWEKIGHNMREALDARIQEITLMRDKLHGCIGCGCLSLKVCSLYNPDDVVREKGAGPRYLMGDKPKAQNTG